jgi:uncharacterized membrane protein
MQSIKSGIAIASAAAALFALGTTVAVPAHAADGTVKCSGVNTCKGTSECKTASSACKGHNTCKGQGWVNKKSAEECKSAGGSVVK